MNIQHLMLTLFLCCCTSIAFSQHQSTFTKGTISSEHVEVINKNLPPHLKIDNTGKMLRSSSRNLVSLWDSTNQYRWDMNNLNWFLEYQTRAVAYNSQGRLLEAETFFPNVTTGNLELHSRVIYNYTASGFRNNTIALILNGMNWDTSSVYNYQYNNNGYLSFYETIDYSIYNGQPVTYIYQNQYTYDANNNLISIDIYRDDFDTNGLEYEEREELTYNSNNNIVKRINYDDRNLTNNTWGTANVDSIFYDANNHLISRRFYDINGDLQARYIFTTNNDGYILDAIYANWAMSTQTWINSSKDISTYNNNNELTEVLYQNWDGSQWVNGIEKSYILTGFGETDVATFKRWDNNLWRRYAKSEGIYNLYEDITKWEYLGYLQDSTVSGSSFYYERFYSLKTVNTTNIVENNFKIYPNPTTEIIYLDLPTELNNAVISIWDLQGRLVHQEDYSQNSINLSALTKGIYLLKVTNDKTSYTSKIIKD